MRDEKDFKRHFKKSVSAQGGFSISLAAPMLAGTPDLFVTMPGYAPVLLEAKFLKELPIYFNRKAGFTELQKHYLNNCNKVHKGIAWGVVGAHYDDKFIYCCLVDPNHNITHNELCNGVLIRNQKEMFDIQALFEPHVPKMQVSYQTKPLTSDIPVDKVSTSICYAENEDDQKEEITVAAM